MNAESTPKGAQESATTTPSVTAGSLSLDDRHAAFCAGLEQGRAERITAEIEDQIHARIHARALEALGMAQRLARLKGPAWAAMVAGDLDER